MLSKKVRIYKFAPDPLPFFCGKIRRYHRSMARRSMKPLSITSYTASSIPTVLRGLPPLGQNMDSKQRRGIRGTFWGFELPRGFHEGATGVPRGCHGGTAGAHHCRDVVGVFATPPVPGDNAKIGSNLLGCVDFIGLSEVQPLLHRKTPTEYRFFAGRKLNCKLRFH